MKTALLISTYNWPEALKVVLRSVEDQSVLPKEIIIADDGSKEETRMIIEDFNKRMKIPVKHLWQEDKGFRKSEILNKAIAATTADYLVQIDGDCIIHPDFIKDHLAMATPGIYLFGSRINIKPEAVPMVLEQKSTKFSIFSGAVRNRSRNLRFPFLRDRYRENKKFSGKVRGCNISYWRKDLIAVNGYNEDINGWGREDSEVILRMLNNGIKGKRLRYGGLLYHLYHPEKSRDNLERNHQIQELTIREKKTWCKNGIDKYLKQPA